MSRNYARLSTAGRSHRSQQFCPVIVPVRLEKSGGEEAPSSQADWPAGEDLVRAIQAIYAALKANNYDPKTLTGKRQTPYVISEESGVNLALLFQALQRLSKPDKIANITAGVMAMSDEEAHYWFAKIAGGKRSAALKAMRILLGE